MMLPLSLSGLLMVERPSTADRALEDALTSIMARLEREKPLHLSRTGDQIYFKGGLLRLVSSWNQLIAINRGEIRVERHVRGLFVRYELWFTQLLIVVAVAVGGVFGPPIMAAPNLSIAGKLAVLLAAWLWFAGGNIAVHAFGFP